MLRQWTRRLGFCLQPCALGGAPLRSDVRLLAIQSAMLCDLCRKREATVHETVCTNLASDIPKRRDLCAECFEAAKSSEANPLMAMSQASCRYCGGKPVVSGSWSPATGSGIHDMNFQCGRCAQEVSKFFDQKWPGFLECARTATVTPELIATIRKSDTAVVYAELEEHMRKWVSERDRI